MSDLMERLAVLTPPQRAELAARLRATNRDKTYPLSSMQRRLWILDRLSPGSSAYAVSAAVRIRGALDVEQLHGVASELVARHESLRTTFTERDGEPVQLVSARAQVDLPVEDLRTLPPREREPACAARITELASEPFDLASGPLLRLALVQLADDEHVLVAVLHHIVTDGWSVRVLFAEFAALYGARSQGQPSPLPALPIDYGAVAEWEQSPQQRDRVQEDLDYWVDRIGGAPPVLELAADRPRPLVQAFRGGSCPLDLSDQVMRALTAAARERGATPFMALLAAYVATLHRYTGQTDIVVGIPVANRPLAEFEGIIGFFANTLAIRTDLSGEPTFDDVLDRVRDACIGAYAHESAPFDQLVERLDPPRDLSRPPLVQISFAYQTQPLPTMQIGGLEFSRLAVPSHAARFDFEVQIVDEGGSFGGLIEFNRDLFDESTMQRFATHLVRFAGRLAAAPATPIADISMLDDDESLALTLIDGDNAQTWPADDLAHQRISRQAALSPEAVAVSCADRTLTYAELEVRANRLARRLISLGVGRDVLVGLFLERSVDVVVAVLAVHKAGGAYVPLDPAYPAARVALMLQDSQAPVVVTDRQVRAQLPETPAAVICVEELDSDIADPTDAQDNGVAVAADALAYVIYTSGSTGRPKGVAIPHQALANFLRSMEQRPGFAAQDTLLAVTNLSFDISILEVLLPLVCGGRVVLAPREVVADGAALARLLADSEATVMQATPSTWQMLVDAGWRGSDGLRMLCGGEALPPALAAQLIDRGAQLWNMYGPTETTIWSAVSLVDAGPICIGEPVANTELLVLDDRRQLVPIGVPGELYIGGHGLARCYLGRPDLTAERFVQHPFGTAEQRLYRTGDLVRRRADGRIEFLGRLDHQVKIRGHRIELGEIEQALGALPEISGAVVTACPHVGGTRLVGYVVAADDVDSADIAARLRERLPRYMLPSAIVRLPAFPLTPNGKIDRRALPDPETSLDNPRPPYRAPGDEFEALVVSVFEQVLGVDRVGLGDDFFDLGGHSLLATRAAARLSDRLGAAVPLRWLFEHPTVAGLARLLGEHAQDVSPDAVAPRPSADVTPGLTGIPRRPNREQPVPLTLAQRRLWFLEQMSPGNRAYVLPAVLRVRGSLDTDTLQRACDDLVERQESLRMVFLESGGQPHLLVLPYQPGIVTVSERVLDLRDHDDRGVELDGDTPGVTELIEEFFAKPHDLTEGPLLRLQIVRASDCCLVLVSMHHIVSDQWSVGVLLRELLEAYAARAAGTVPALPPLGIHYADVAAWEHSPARIEAAAAEDDAALAAWVQRLTGAPAELALPSTHSRPPVKTYRGGALTFHVSGEQMLALRELARREKATLFMSLLAAFEVVLSRLSGATDIVVGTPVAGRRHAEVEPLIGLFVNTVALRVDLSEATTFRELLARVRTSAIEAIERQQVPFDRVVEALAPERSLARTPVFQVGFALQNVPFPSWSGAGLQIEPLHVDAGTAKYDMELLFTERDDDLEGRLEFSLDLFERSDAERVVRYLLRVLGAVAADPDLDIERCPLLDETESAQIRALGTGPATEWPNAGLIHECIQAQAAATPEAEAVRFEGSSLSYAELDTLTNQLAHRLRRHGVGKDVLVGVYMERSVEMVVSLVAVLKAGGAYVPVDPGYPRARVELMLDDASPPVVLTQRRLVADLPDVRAQVLVVDELREQLSTEPSGPPEVVVDGEDLAYVIYTSGSTGKPKGVMNVHAGIRNRLLWMQDTFGLDGSDRVFQKTPFSFDVSVWEFFWPLMTGACLVVARPEGHKDPTYLLETIRRESITTLHFVPSMLQVFLGEPGVPECASLRRVICSGEALPRELQERFFERSHAQLYNLYGPTEAAVDVTFWECRRDGDPRPVPIGHPIANTEMLVVDRHLQLVPSGVVGELCIGGRNLARGYLDRPELTAERFVPHPVDPSPGARLYRTGDLARTRDDGAIEYLGRLDHQVKLRGLRIELGEIEQALGEHPAVREAIAIAREHRGDTRLVAYASGANLPPTSELIAWLRDRLPDYMVPSTVVILDAFPLSRNGKVDRAALPEPEFTRPQLATTYAAPATPLEHVVHDIWARLLGLERVGVEDNFFELGGHSLLMAQIRSALQEDLKCRLSLVELFHYPTVRTLAAHLEATEDASATATGVPDRVGARLAAQSLSVETAARRARARTSRQNDQGARL